MKSGIYKLTFANGDTYVGKSVDITQRWKQHFDKLEKGTAAKNMLEVYRLLGWKFPKTEVLLECHPDVLDEYENYFINALKPTLNTQIPKPRTQVEQEALIRHANEGRAIYSTPVIMMTLENVHNERMEALERVEVLEKELEEIESDFGELDEAWDDRALQELRKEEKFRALESNLSTLSSDLITLRGEFNKLSEFKVRIEKANWFERLFKLW